MFWVPKQLQDPKALPWDPKLFLFYMYVELDLLKCSF